jgi:hypothetical protein
VSFVGLNLHTTAAPVTLLAAPEFPVKEPLIDL